MSGRGGVGLSNVLKVENNFRESVGTADLIILKRKMGVTLEISGVAGFTPFSQL